MVRRGAGGRCGGDDQRAVRAARRAGLARVTATRPLHGSATVGRCGAARRGAGGGRAGCGGARAGVRAVEGRRAAAGWQRVVRAGHRVGGGRGRRVVARSVAGAAVAADGRGRRRDESGAAGSAGAARGAQGSWSRSGSRSTRSRTRWRTVRRGSGSSCCRCRTSCGRRSPPCVGSPSRSPTGWSTGDEVAEVGRTIEQEAKRLDQLVSDLLDLARLGADDFRLDITDVDLTIAGRRGRSGVGRPVCGGRGDAAGRQSWHARDGAHRSAAAAAGVRRAHLQRGAGHASRVRRSCWRCTVDGVFAVLQVRDGGPGLSEEDYRLAFQRGVLHSRYQGMRPVGTGIGLALVHGLVTRLGGAVDAGPAPEGGARFSVRLQSPPPAPRLGAPPCGHCLAPPGFGS